MFTLKIFSWRHNISEYKLEIEISRKGLNTIKLQLIY